MKLGALNPPQRLLMGPGPSAVHPRVFEAIGKPVLGHLDPAFLEIMDETRSLLQAVFGTENKLTLPVSGTGSSGMEAALVNILEPGDHAVVCVNGAFGGRMADIVERYGAHATRVDSPWGEIVPPEKVADALNETPNPKVAAIVHVETSTGVLQPLREVARLAHESGALFLVDAVTSLGGAPVDVDETGIDVCYSATQKCLSCPPGLAPITFSERAVEAIENRRSKVASWYLDMTLISKYWGSERIYHHTAPISMIYALRESLRIVVEERPGARYERHRLHSAALCAGLEAIGLTLGAQEGYRAPMLNMAFIPDGVGDASARRRLLDEFNIEIGGGLGAFAGKAWRIGLMGESCSRASVMRCLDGLESILRSEGLPIPQGAGLSAAMERYESGS
ncbi:MAG: alanine--glyoxylate aminotransferase family protein [Candidatus Poribacteria bacterium]|nr:alanine--glyoxylate aminotransferase family protein [Candidatus Poribacteria bacterium]